MKNSIFSCILIFLFIIQIPQSTSVTDEFEPEYINPLGSSYTKLNQIRSEILQNQNLFFIKNSGQLENDAVRFYSGDGSVWFTDDGVWFRIFENNGDFNDPDIRQNQQRSVILKLNFLNANPVRPIGFDKQDHYYNYFYGNTSANWQVNVPQYASIYYRDLYDGIDLRYYVNENGIKYDFIVHPGADYTKIRLKYNGAVSLLIDQFGNLEIHTGLKVLYDSELFIYQDYNNLKTEISGRFELIEYLTYGFKVTEQYNPSHPLIIDPFLQFSTFLGGTKTDFSNDIAVDKSGNCYVTGGTWSPDFPTTPGANDTTYSNVTDCFVSKFDQNGSKLIYSTFIGGISVDIGYGIEVEWSGNAYVCGRTLSTDFPTSAGAFDTSHSGVGIYDLFILKLNSEGSQILFSTLIGSDKDDSICSDILVDSNGNSYIAGETTSQNFPTTSGAFNTTHNLMDDVFVLKLNSLGTDLVYSTFIGGSKSDLCMGLALDDDNNIYLCGTTYSTDFPISSSTYDSVFNGSSDGFVLKLNKMGTDLIYSTYLGGEPVEQILDIAVDSKGCSSVTGYTYVQDYPVTPGAFHASNSYTSGIAVTKFNSAGTALVFSTIIDGEKGGSGTVIDVDSNDNIFICGYSTSNDLPLTENSYDKTYNGDWDVYIIELTPDGTGLKYSTYLGGSKPDEPSGICIDDFDDLYIVGDTISLDFPYTDSAYSTQIKGSDDLFVSKLKMQPFIYVSNLTETGKIIGVKTAYSRYGSYNFNVNIENIYSVQDLENLTLILDPDKTNIRLNYNRKSNKFTEINDDSDFITLDSGSNAFYNNYKWSVDFNLIFNWNYPDENLNDIQIILNNSISNSMTLVAENFYKVENDLKFNGILVVRGEDGQIISANDLVRGGEILKWTGLKPVYESTVNIHPPKNEFNISLFDENGKSWRNSPESGLPFYIEAPVPVLTNSAGFEYILNFSGIPVENDKSDQRYTVKIDSENLTFSNPSPDNRTWQNKSVIPVCINITDHGGGLVNGSSIKYSTSNNKGISWTAWEKTSDINFSKSVIVKNDIFLEDGENQIRWQATDSVGNGPVISEKYSIIVDTVNVTFSNVIPKESEASPDELVTVGITITDSTSGVNGSAIEYAYSNDNGITWSQWKHFNDVENNNSIMINFDIFFPNGTENLIKWRAADLAGNGPVESQIYRINVNIWLSPIVPLVKLLTPANGFETNQTSINLTWKLTNENFSAITYNLYLGSTSDPVLLKSGLMTTYFLLTGLEIGKKYYWKVIPEYLGRPGHCTSGIWWFNIVGVQNDSEKLMRIEITSPDSITIAQGEKKSLEITVTNTGKIDTFIELKLSSIVLESYLSLNDYSIMQLNINESNSRLIFIDLPDSVDPGNFELNITAVDAYNENNLLDSHIVFVEVLEKSGDDSQKFGISANQSLLIIIIFIIVLIIILLFSYIWKVRRPKELEEKELAEAEGKPAAPGTTIIAKPGTISAPTIIMDQIPADQEPKPSINDINADILSLPPGADKPAEGKTEDLVEETTSDNFENDEE